MFDILKSCQQPCILVETSYYQAAYGTEGIFHALTPLSAAGLDEETILDGDFQAAI